MKMPIITLDKMSIYHLMNQVPQMVLRNIERLMLCNLERFKNIGELQMMQVDSQKVILMVNHPMKANTYLP